MAPDDVSRRLAEVRGSTERLLAALRDPPRDDAYVRRPSLLPGWSRAHVLAHVARNADAVRRTLEGARRREPVPMYDSEEQRAADIEAGSRRDAQALVEDVAASAARLDEVFTRMRPDDWEAEGVTRTGRTPAWRLIGSRWREVEIHRVDLDDGYGPGDWPASFVAPLLPALLDTDRLGPRLPAGMAVDVTDTDSGRRWAIGPESGRRVAVTGPSWALVAWLTGRPAAVRRELASPPELSPWS